MSEERFFTLAPGLARQRAHEAIDEAADGYTVQVSPPKMNPEQRARFHAICNDIARSGMKWSGKPRTPKEWKVLLISGHATATGEGSDVVAGLEGELVNVRESTTQIGRRRGASLIEYATAFADTNGIQLRDPKRLSQEREYGHSAT